MPDDKPTPFTLPKETVMERLSGWLSVPVLALVAIGFAGGLGLFGFDRSDLAGFGAGVALVLLAVRVVGKFNRDADGED